jgi:S-(hydroxymethyl)mycothiol dehydrogenase
VDRGIVLTEPGRFGLEELELDAPGPGEVLVRIEASGVCHSDLHIVEHDGWGHRLPVLLGHEGAGVVEAVGEGVSTLAPGDRIVVGWRAPCGECRWCLRGDPRRCRTPVRAQRRVRIAGGDRVTGALQLGTFATRTVVHERAAVRIPDGLPVEQACLIGCAVATGVMSALETARVWEGSRVAVIGCGAVGLSVVQGCRIAGAVEIRAIDLDERKLEAARRFGATDTGEGEELDFVFDVVGLAATLESALGMLGHAGTLVYVGLPRAGQTAHVPLERLFAKRATIRVSHGGDHLPAEDFPRLAEWALEGKLDLAGMVSREIGLEDVAAAFEDMKRGDVIRSIVRP